MSKHQLELLCRIRGGLSPLAGVTGRAVGAVCRNLEILRQRGYLRHHGRSRRYLLTRLGRAITGA